MEDRYKHGLIHLCAGTYIAPMVLEEQPYEMDDKYYSNVVVFIEPLDSSEEGYIIMKDFNEPIIMLRGTNKPGRARIVNDFDALYYDRDLLGRVTIYYNRKPEAEFSNYEEFWEAVKR